MRSHPRAEVLGAWLGATLAGANEYDASDIAKAIEAAKADSKKPALLLVSNGEGEVRFVAVPVD